jgi:hypothetical protein
MCNNNTVIEEEEEEDEIFSMLNIRMSRQQCATTIPSLVALVPVISSFSACHLDPPFNILSFLFGESNEYADVSAASIICPMKIAEGNKVDVEPLCC